MDCLWKLFCSSNRCKIRILTIFFFILLFIFVLQSQTAVNRRERSAAKLPDRAFSTLLASFLAPAETRSDIGYLKLTSSAPFKVTAVTPEAAEATASLLQHDNTSADSNGKRIRGIFLPASCCTLDGDNISIPRRCKHGVAAVELDGSNAVRALVDIASLLGAKNVTMTAPFRLGPRASSSSSSSVNSSDTAPSPVALPSSTAPLYIEKWRMLHGPRLFLRCDAVPSSSEETEEPAPTSSSSCSISSSTERNAIASWLVGSDCYGDAVLASIDPTQICDFTQNDFFSLISGFTPEGLMAAPSPLFRLPWDMLPSSMISSHAWYSPLFLIN